MTTPAPGHVHCATAKPLLGDTIDGLPERVLLQLAVPKGATPTHHRIFNNGWFIDMADAKFGGQVCAWIRLSEGSGASMAQVQDYCRQYLASYKLPHHARFVDAFPMTATGKMQKYPMREAMAAELAP